MTRRVIARQFGDIADVEIETVDDAPPAEGRVAIAVRAAGVNPADVKSVRGQFGTDATRLPLRLGSEISGVVTELGAGVEGFAVGDEVAAMRVVGGFADRAVVPVRNMLHKPASVSFEQAAALLVAGTTAWHLLEATSVAEGDVVLVHGASGSVGSVAAQLAIARGARVIGTASAANAELVRSLGATWVPYGEGLAERVVSAGAPTVALDTVGTDEAVEVSLALVPRERVASIAAWGRGAEAGILMLGAGGDPGDEIRAAAREPLLGLAASGRLRVQVGRTLPLDRAVEALELVASGHAGGKVLLVP